jgi:hypothetical protein
MEGGDAVAGGSVLTDQPPTEQDNIAAVAALREEQLQNAVAFLSHPKVRGSAVSTKRSFLEKKGLTAAEIDEAFKRVPEAPAVPAAAATIPATTSAPTYGANNLVTYTQQNPVAGQPAVVPAAALQPVIMGPGSGALVPMHPQEQVQPIQAIQQPVRWTQVVLALGVAAAGITGLHLLITPRLTSWVSHMRAARTAAAEAEAQRIAALTAALESLAAGQSRLQDTLNSLQAAMDKQQLQQDERCRLDVEPGRVAYSGEVLRSRHSEYLRCQSPGATAQQQQQQQRQQQYSYSSGSAIDASRAAAVRRWDRHDASSSPWSTSAFSSRPAAVNGSGPPEGFEVTPRNMDLVAAPAATHISEAAAAGAGGLMGPGSPSPHGQQQQQQGGRQAGRPDEAPHSAAFQEACTDVAVGDGNDGH